MKTPRLMACLRTLSLGLAIGGASLTFVPVDRTVVHADESVAAEVRQAVASYKRRNYADAVQKFEVLLAKRLDVDAKATVRAEVTEALAQEFTKNSLTDASLQQRLRGIGNWVLSGRASDGDGRSLSATGRIANEPEGVKRFVDEYMTEQNLMIRSDRAKVISEKYGEYAVTYIQQNYLASETAQERGLARQLLATIGSRATLPLVQVLKASDDTQREYAAHALGDIRDARALPMLATVAADSGQPRLVREACEAAIGRITGGVGISHSAAELWLEQARGYYMNASVGGWSPGTFGLVGADIPGALPLLLDDPTRAYPVWRWRGEALVMENIPVWNYADTLAEESANYAVRLAFGDNNVELAVSAAALACRIAAKQYTSNQAQLSSRNEDSRNAVISGLGENGISRLSHLGGLAGSMGSNVVLIAIDESLTEGYTDVTAALCDIYGELRSNVEGDMTAHVEPMEDDGEDDDAEGEDTEDGDDEMEGEEAPVAIDLTDVTADPFAPLSRALRSPSRVVRYAAARALLIAGRTVDHPSIALAQQEFAASLEETELRTVILIAENPQIRTRYAAALGATGSARVFSVRIFSKLEDGLHHARNSAAVDAIILEGAISQRAVTYWEPSSDGQAAGMSDARVESAVKLLRDDVRTADVPLLLASSEDDADNLRSVFGDLMNSDAFSADSVIVHGEDANIDSAELHERLGGFIEPTAAAREASTNSQVAKSARALHHLNPNHTVYDVNLIMSKLGASIGADEGRQASAKVAAAGAIEHMSAYRGLSPQVGADLVAILTGVLASDPEGNTVNTAQVRAAAASALGGLLRTNPGLWKGGDTLDALLATARLQPTGSDHEDVIAARHAAGVALGHAPMDIQERLRVIDALAAGNIELPAGGGDDEGGGDDW